jgi:hypothetical protein
MCSGDRWLFHHSTWELWVNNLHFLNLFVMETTRSKSWTDETLSTVGLKKVTKIGIWNVRALYVNGKIEQLGAEMNNYKLDILGVSEVRWNQFGEINTAGVKTFIF